MAPEVVDTEDPTRLLLQKSVFLLATLAFSPAHFLLVLRRNSGSRFARYCTEIYSMRSILQRNLVFHFARFCSGVTDFRLSWNLFVIIIADAWDPFYTLCPEIHRRFKSFEMVSLFVTRLKRQQTFVPFRCCLDFLNVSLDSRSMFDVQFVSSNSIGFQIGIFQIDSIFSNCILEPLSPCDSR